MNNIIKRKWNQNSMVIIEDLHGMAFQAESGGHTFQISGIDGDGNPVALSGTPAGVMLRADGQDVALTCSVSGGVVSATLPANAYVVPGRFGLTIFLTSDGQKTAIYAAVGTVGKTSSGTVAPPAGSDVVDLVNAIAAAVATIPASYTDLMASIAPTYSSSGLYAVGSYAWYNGKLYRCTTAITTAETWTAAHWTLANIGSDLVDLKSAFCTETGVKDMVFVSGYYNNQNVGDVVNSITSSSGYVCAIAPCKPGDVIYANVYGASAARAWAFLDKDYKVIAREKSGTYIDSGRIPDAPEGSAYITLNNRLGSGYLPSGFYGRIGIYPSDLNKSLQNSVNSIAPSIVKNNLLVGHKDVNETTNGITVTGNAINGVKISGTASENTEIRLFGDKSNILLESGKTYKYTAENNGETNISASTWGLILRRSAPNEQTLFEMVVNEGLMFSMITNFYVDPYIRVIAGQQIDLTVFPKLIEFSDDINDVIKNTSDKKTSNMLDPALLSPGVTKNSVTITNNHDGTMTLNGTNTGDNILMDVTNEYGILLEKDHTYLFSSNGNDDSIYPSNNSYRMDIRKVGEVSVESKGYEYAFGGIITPTETMLCRIFIWVLSGYTIENLTITPTLFDITDKNVGVDNSERIRVATYNVGNFANGGSGQAAGNDEIYRGLINAFQKCNADMYMFCEWDTYWNYNQGIESEVVLGRLKPYKSNWVWNRPTKWIMQMIYSDYPFVYERYGMFDDGHSRHYVDDVVLIKGKPVHFICVHLHGTDIDSRYGDYDKIKELIDRFGAEYYVIAGDFNLGYTEQGLSLQTAREEVNYMQTKTNTNSVQGGFYGALANDGFMNTYASGNDIDDVRPYDNFFVSKNIRIRNAYVVESAGSDHYPLCVDLEIM